MGVKRGSLANCPNRLNLAGSESGPMGELATSNSISPAELEVALRHTKGAGIPHAWITPSHMMTEDHWEVVKKVWIP